MSKYQNILCEFPKLAYYSYSVIERRNLSKHIRLRHKERNKKSIITSKKVTYIQGAELIVQDQ